MGEWNASAQKKALTSNVSMKIKNDAVLPFLSRPEENFCLKVKKELAKEGAFR